MLRCPRHRSFRSFRLRTAAVAVGSIALYASPAGAKTACHVEVVGDETPAWTSAARDLEETLTSGRTLSDCARVVVRVEGERAHVSYATTDGRRADRNVFAPGELAATVSALGTMPPVVELPPLNERPAERPPDRIVAGTASDQATRSREARAVDPLHPNVVYGVLAGGRGGAGGLMSPMIDAYGAIGLGAWQLGILGRFEPHYARPNVKAQVDTSVIAIGVSAGRRRPMAPNAMLVYGGTLYIAALHEDRSKKNEPSTQRIDPRFGLYAGLVLPTRSFVRFRVNLTVELTPPRLVERSAEGEALTPWWALGLAVGAELGKP